jgi:hypothetical protein
MDPMTVKYNLYPKPKKSKAANVNGKLAELLAKMQDRIGRIASEAAVAVGKLEDRATDQGFYHAQRMDKLEAEAERESKLNLSRATLAAKEYEELKKKLSYMPSGRIDEIARRLLAVEQVAAEALSFKNNLRRIVDVQTQEEVRRTSTAPLSSTATGMYTGGSIAFPSKYKG